MSATINLSDETLRLLINMGDPQTDETLEITVRREDQPVFRLMWNVGKLASRRYFYSEAEARLYLIEQVLDKTDRPVRYQLTDVRTAAVLASSEAASGTDPARGS